MAIQIINQSAQITNFTVKAGDTLEFGFTIRDKTTNQLESLTDKTIHCQVRDKAGTLKQDLTFGDGIVIGSSPAWDTATRGPQTPIPPVADEDVENGLAVLTILPDTTAYINACKELFYDIEVTEPDDTVRTHREGTISGTKDVTR